MRSVLADYSIVPPLRRFKNYGTERDFSVRIWLTVPTRHWLRASSRNKVLRYAEMLNENLSLFVAEEWALKRQLAVGLAELARAQLYVGTSSWKYEGWLGSVYRPERYSSRGRFSKTQFERDCLKEYAEIFHTVSGDFAFYQFPSTAVWSRLFAQVPTGFRFAFKAPEEITTPAFPRHPRYGSRAGQLNPLFLDAKTLTAQFLTPLEPYATAIAVIIFEFPSSLPGAFGDNSCLTDALGQFFDKLPHGFQYAVEPVVGVCWPRSTFGPYTTAASLTCLILGRTCRASPNRWPNRTRLRQLLP